MKKFLKFTLLQLLKNNNFSTSQNRLISFQKRVFGKENKKIRILCTISSGQDSITTLFLFVHLKKKEWLQVLYCNHFWQTKNFFSARSLFQISYFLKVPYILVLAENRVLTENESREWRKKIFSRFSQIENIPISFTGHTETDTLEKNLSHIFRGTSPGGFSKKSILNYRKTLGSFFPIRYNTHYYLLDKNHIKKFFFPDRSKINKINRIYLDPNKLNITSFFQKKIPIRIKNQPTVFVPWKFKPSNKKFFLFSQSVTLKKQSNKKFFYSKQQNNLLYKLKNRVFLSRKKSILQNIKTFSRENVSYSFSFSNKFYNANIFLFTILENSRRQTITKLINFYNLPIINDVSNFSSSFGRNKIRHQFIPFTRVLLNPNSESLLVNFFRMISDENSLSEKIFQQREVLYKIVILNSAQETNKKSKLLKQKILRNQVFDLENQSLVQKFFFDYKNINLKFSQIKSILGQKKH